MAHELPKLPYDFAALEPHIRRLAEKTWTASRKTGRVARTVVLKLKTRDFRILTRSLTPALPPACLDELIACALTLRDRVGADTLNVPAATLYRLVGVGLANFHDAESALDQADLFSGAA